MGVFDFLKKGGGLPRWCCLDSHPPLPPAGVQAAVSGGPARAGPYGVDSTSIESCNNSLVGRSVVEFEQPPTRAPGLKRLPEGPTANDIPPSGTGLEAATWDSVIITQKNNKEIKSNKENKVLTVNFIFSLQFVVPSPFHTGR